VRDKESALRGAQGGVAGAGVFPEQTRSRPEADIPPAPLQRGNVFF